VLLDGVFKVLLQEDVAIDLLNGVDGIHNRGDLGRGFSRLVSKAPFVIAVGEEL